jgi:hypothetical protein
MNHSKKDEGPISFLYREFSSLEFKEHQTIKSLIKNYYPLNKDEEIYIKDISIKDKNEFISQIKKIFHEMSISMETIEYIFSEYYQYLSINNNNANTNLFGPLQKSEVINKLGINSNMFKKILFLYEKIILNVKDNSDNNLNLDLREDKKDIDDVEMEDGNSKKNNVDEKIRNINSFCNNILNSFEDSNGIKKKEANYKEYANQNEYEIISQTLTQKQEDELRKQLEHYKQSIM